MAKSALEASLSIQEQYFPDGVCFGCGPANELGLRIRSFPAPAGPGTVAVWQPDAHHAASPGVLNGGIVGALLDCHSITAVLHEVAERGGDPTGELWATSEYSVRLLRPTSPDAPLELFATIIEFDADRAVTDATLTSEGKPRATCRAVFKRFRPRD